MTDDDKDDTIETLAEIVEPTRAQSTEVGFPSNDPLDDYEFARQKIREAVNYGKGSVESLILLAQQSNHPRVYEVLNEAIKTMVESSKTLMDTKKVNVDVTKAQGNLDDGTKTIHNNLFVGSTADLQRMLDELREKKIVQETD